LVSYKLVFFTTHSFLQSALNQYHPTPPPPLPPAAYSPTTIKLFGPIFEIERIKN
jgi:hypothetical protein